MDILTTAITVFTVLTSVVGAASLVVQGIAKVTAITPSTRDDEIVGKVQSGLAVTSRFLDKIALNFPATQARK